MFEWKRDQYFQGVRCYCASKASQLGWQMTSNRELQIERNELANLQFLTYFTMDLLVFEVLGGRAGDAFSKCIPDLFLEGILGVIFGRLFEF